MIKLGKGLEGGLRRWRGICFRKKEGEVLKRK